MGDIPKGTATYSYAVSKGAVHHMTRVLSNDLAHEFITVNAIAPGPFVSKMTAFALASEEGRAKSAEGVPLGRVGSPEDIAGALQFLCGRGGAYLSGAILPLSGGMQSNAPGNLFNEDL
jgi:NAD(P)-dependent dehydrogenase (short-subunit alcohol dehydrogenase family)